jgi:hypothetical protein
LIVSWFFSWYYWQTPLVQTPVPHDVPSGTKTVPQTPAVHTDDAHGFELNWQSVTTRQALPVAQAGQVPPPQSTSVSFPSLIPSVQVDAVQAPLTHANPVVQIVPQLPQLFASVFRFTSHPFAGFLSQSAKPALQVSEHTPEEQLPAPFETVPAQATPQVPQLLGLLCVSSQIPPHTRPDSAHWLVSPLS